MDFHILIVIGCVFSASLLSFLFINKIFRRKTFEEVVAEKRALSANLYKAGAGGGNAATKKPKKKELKREKKQRQREQQKDANNEAEEDFSDGQSEGQNSVEDEVGPGLSKQHVEFEPEPEILTEQRRPSIAAEKESQPSAVAKKGKKDKRNASKGGAAAVPAPSTVSGILVNKNEPVVVRSSQTEETPSLNNFEVRAPKDVVELKKQEQKERKEDNNNKQQAQKKNGVAKKEKAAEIELALSAPVTQASKQLVKQQQPGTSSPKTQHNQANNKTKQQQHQHNKQKQKDTLTSKDLAQALDKLTEHQNQTIGVSALMNVFARAELNRSEIQILIDYLLNKQQDMPASHAEWSDDICQKLKRQLEEKEKLLAEEQEASIGIQAKLRELRQEINTERAQMHGRIQAYNDKLQGKEQELLALNQELSSVNDKLTIERQQFQAMLREKQASSDLLPQLQRLQQDLAHKEKCLADMTAFVNAESQQKTELIQQQAQQLLALEQQRDELEVHQNNSIFELEQRKQLETENGELKVELRNLHNALESAKVDLAQSQNAAGAAQSELTRVCNTELQELRQQAVQLEASNQALNQQLNQASTNAVQATAAQSEQAQAQSELLAQKQMELSALQAQLSSLNEAQAKQQQQANILQTQLQEAQQTSEQWQAKERQLQQELQEQREKNNQEIKLLQQQKAVVAANGGQTSSASSAKSEQQRIRELYQRLYPDAVKALAGNAMNTSFDEWLEQVLATHIKQQEKQTLSSSHKSTQSNNSSSSKHNSTNTTSTATSTTTHNNISSNNSSSNSQSSAEQLELHKQNLQLRECNDKLTQLVTKTTNTLMDLEQRAREQDEHWRGIVSQKEQLISKLQQHASNGEQDI